MKPNNAVNIIEAYVKIEMSLAGAKLYASVIPICPTAADNLHQASIKLGQLS